MKAHTKRVDIQVLRAIAVLLVVGYHAFGAAYLPRGYLGVDIFFVISGYLVTRMIVDAIDEGAFSYLDFYSRRARRLLPAAYCTFACTLIAAGFFLTQADYQDFLDQLVGAVTFTSDIAMLRQTGYFQTAAAFKPLMHAWSLSVEEQFYAIVPFVLVTIGAARRLRVTATLGVLSLGAYLVMVTTNPDAAFYLLPSRAWELLLGAVVALVVQRRHRAAIPTPLLALAATFLIVVPFIPVQLLRAGLDSVLVTGATALLLAGHHGGLEEHPLAKRVAVVGDWSYSLYLVHWPLFAFATCAYAGDGVPGRVRAGLFVVAVLLAYLQYRFVEQTTRSMALPKVRLAMLAASVLLLAPVPWLAMHAARGKDYAWIRRTNFGLDASCSYQGAAYDERSACVTSRTPTVALWGDSFAMHLGAGLRELPLVQMTKSACAPLLGVANTAPNGKYDRAFGQTCIAFNESVFQYLAAHPAITTVVISSTFAHLDGKTQQLHDGKVDAMTEDAVVNAYATEVSRLRAVGKKVVVVAFPPRASFDRGICLERMDAGLFVFGRSNCDVPEQQYRRRTSRAIALLTKVQTVADVPVLWPHDLLCDGTVCHSLLNGKFVYHDASHMSYDGSREFAKAFGLAGKVVQVAR